MEHDDTPAPMTMDRYQRLAGRTINESNRVNRLVRALGLCGEAGEVADIIKKVEGHGHHDDPARLAEELGDVLWYIAAIATDNGISMNYIAEGNVTKLRRRYPEGFTEQASRERVD